MSTEAEAETRRQDAILRLYLACGDIGTVLDVDTSSQQLADAATRSGWCDVAVVSVSRAIPEGRVPPRSRDGGDLLLTRSGLSPRGRRYPQGYVLPGRGAESYVPPFKSPDVIKMFQRGLPFALPGRGPITAVVEDDPEMVAALVPVTGPLTVMCAPLLVGQGRNQRLLGSFEAWRIGGGKPFTDADLAAGVDLARRTAIVLENARQTALLRTRVQALQANLLPPPTRETAAVVTAGAYRSGGGLSTAGAGTVGDVDGADVDGADGIGDVAGHWHDVITLSGGRAALIVGAVPGHGQDAVAAMGQIRSSTRTLAEQDWEPAELLARLDTTVAEAGPPAIGSQCLYAVVDPVNRRLQIAAAGPLAPLLVTPDGAASVLALTPGPALGSGSGSLYMDTHHPIPPGATLALTTAGDDQEQRRLLAAVADGAGRDATVGTIAARLVEAAGAGDATALVSTVRELPAAHHATWTWPARPEAAGAARRALPAFLARLTPGAVPDEVEFGLELVVSELVTNAVRYGHGDSVSLRLIVADGRLTAEVSDPASTAPHLRRAAADDEGGRGIDIVHKLGLRWGTRFRAAPGGGPSLGKTIWTQFALGPREDSPTGDPGGLGDPGDLDDLGAKFPEP